MTSRARVEYPDAIAPTGDGDALAGAALADPVTAGDALSLGALAADATGSAGWSRVAGAGVDPLAPPTPDGLTGDALHVTTDYPDATAPRSPADERWSAPAPVRPAAPPTVPRPAPATAAPRTRRAPAATGSPRPGAPPAVRGLR